MPSQYYASVGTKTQEKEKGCCPKKGNERIEGENKIIERRNKKEGNQKSRQIG
jgi:hypothetical protein